MWLLILVFVLLQTPPDPAAFLTAQVQADMAELSADSVDCQHPETAYAYNRQLYRALDSLLRNPLAEHMEPFDVQTIFQTVTGEWVRLFRSDDGRYTLTVSSFRVCQDGDLAPPLQEMRILGPSRVIDGSESRIVNAYLGSAGFVYDA